jgi:hypothetical protein
MAESPAIKLLATIRVNQGVRKANASLRDESFSPVDIEPLIADWIEDVEERLQGFERALANDIGPAVHKVESMPNEDPNPPFRLK